MTIDTNHNSVNRDIVFSCDDCGEDLDTEKSDFNAALRVFKNAGWGQKKLKNGWEHLCPSCKDERQQREIEEDFSHV